MKKQSLLMLPCIAAVAIATFVGKKTMESNALKSNDLLAQNVEALTSPEDSGYDASRCNGPSKYSTVGSTVGEAQIRKHIYGSVGGDDGIDEVYNAEIIECFASGNGTKTGTKYSLLIPKEPSSYVKCEGEDKHYAPIF